MGVPRQGQLQAVLVAAAAAGMGAGLSPACSKAALKPPFIAMPYTMEQHCVGQLWNKPTSADMRISGTWVPELVHPGLAHVDRGVLIPFQGSMRLPGK